MKIAVVNQPLGNRGDEAAHRALIRSLVKRFPEAYVDVIFMNENKMMIDDFVVMADTVRYINLRSLSKAANKCMKLTMIYDNVCFTLAHPLLRKYYNIIGKYDCVICAPGGICMGGFMKWDHIWQLYIAMKQNKKIIYWGRSIGPFSDDDFDHSMFKKISKSLISYFDYISLRDDVSFELAKSMNAIPDKTVDSAFLEKTNWVIPATLHNQIGIKPYVVFVPNELKWHYRYIDKSKVCIDNFYLYVIERLMIAFPKHNIVMLPQTCKTVINDYGYFAELRSKSRYKDDIIVIDENQSSDIQQGVIYNSDFVVGARYHSIVFAINNGVPFLSLSYEHKMRGMLEILGLDNRQINIEDIFNAEEVDANILKIIDEKLKNKSSIEIESKMAKKIVNDAFDRMCMNIQG